ncbi:hypothetical protein JA33_119 [Dickeya phage vB_DsoM_JA33]|uniref:Uncharacterized protein n=3 Tax=Salmondvirus JA11 TaxID=2734141 RepID=A0A384ZW94_9CAUD|nr:hypothetical protein HOU32_gp119 [Dickeya phage vB_DsoM_JA11]AXG66523.1 hypothetical protein JA13_120 [Dickeya phage vB_DsoM_JA13]AXG67493.1 hypothetical protein JA33_119 [Dickeya phage vB_DsoM_JA33]AYD79924.1 hypothetical protein JA11_119 [Dickeya phage vB_DsoM_JA11]
MEIITRSLPSAGWKSGLPPSFDMKPFSGKQAYHISKAIEQDNLAPILLEALPEVLSIPIDMLSIQDAHALVFQQRMLIENFPLRVFWTCNKPLFEYANGVFPDLRDDDELPLNTFPCDAHNVGVIDESAVTVLTLRANSDEFDLPRMRNYEVAHESRFNWFVAHMGLNFDENYALLERQTDLNLWMRLDEWVKAAQHGIPTTITMSCPVCKRESDRTWEMKAKIFEHA